MALDPQIALGVRPVALPPVEIQTPLERFGKILSLRNLMTQGEMGQLQLQQLQQQIQRQKNITDFFATLDKQQQQTQPQLAIPAAPTVQPPVTAPSEPPPLLSAQPPAGGVPGSAFWPPSDTLAPAIVTPQPAPAPVTPTPAGGTVPQTAPALTPAPAPAAAPLTIPLAGGSYGTFPNINFAKLYQIDPTGATAKMLIDQEKLVQENQSKRIENTTKFHERLGKDAQSVLDAKDPEAAKNAVIGQLHADRLIDDDTARQWMARPFDRATFERIARAASDVKTQHEIAGIDLDNFRKDKANVAQDVQGVHDQAGWDRVYPTWSPAMQQRYGPVYSPEVKAAAIQSGVTAAEYPKYETEQIQRNATKLGAAMAQGLEAYKAELAKLPPDEQRPFLKVTNRKDLEQRALTPEQYITTSETEKQNAIRNLMEVEKTKLDKDKFDAQFGAGSAESIAAQIFAHPDSIKEMLTPDNRTAVLNVWNRQHPGLPLPTMLDNTSLQQETAAKNTVGDIQWIRNALQNPKIRDNVGPLLGNLQNVEQATGVATGLTGADAQMAQEFRTRMRTMLANEAGAMHARINPKTMDDLSQSSGRVNMNAQQLLGALDGVEGYARNKLDGFERQRFGGQMRPDEARGLAGGIPQATRDALVKAGVGRHQGNDGRWYQVNPDGTVQSIPTPVEAKQK